MKEVNTLDAFSAAYTDFKRHIAKTTKGGTELDNFLSDITNYKITIYLEDGNYVVRFTPLPHNGVVLRGGGANYEIDAKTATVMKFAPSR